MRKLCVILTFVFTLFVGITIVNAENCYIKTDGSFYWGSNAPTGAYKVNVPKSECSSSNSSGSTTTKTTTKTNTGSDECYVKTDGSFYWGSKPPEGAYKVNVPKSECSSSNSSGSTTTKTNTGSNECYVKTDGSFYWGSKPPVGAYKVNVPKSACSSSNSSGSTTTDDSETNPTYGRCYIKKDGSEKKWGSNISVDDTWNDLGTKTESNCQALYIRYKTENQNAGQDATKYKCYLKSDRTDAKWNTKQPNGDYELIDMVPDSVTCYSMIEEAKHYDSTLVSCGKGMLKKIPYRIVKIVKTIINIIQIGVPILLIVLGMTFFNFIFFLA